MIAAHANAIIARSPLRRHPQSHQPAEARADRFQGAKMHRVLRNWSVVMRVTLALVESPPVVPWRRRPCGGMASEADGRVRRLGLVPLA